MLFYLFSHLACVYSSRVHKLFNFSAIFVVPFLCRAFCINTPPPVPFSLCSKMSKEEFPGLQEKF